MPENRPVSRLSTILYLLLLGGMVGMTLMAGAVTAPVVFHASDYLAGAKELSQFESGLIMTEVFIRYNNMLFIVLLVIAGYELLALFRKNSHWFIGLVALLLVLAGMTFVFYHTPMILAAQEGGEALTQTEAFAVIHHQSEAIFKGILLGFVLLFCGRLYQALSRKGFNEAGS